MNLPPLIAELEFPDFDWQAACKEVADSDERPTWAYTWPAGLRLLGDLAELIDLRGLRVCDLGCGRGLLGLAALQLGAASVHFCDASETVLSYVQECLDHNGLSQRSSCHPHRWGTPIPGAPFDLILGGDILYRPECFTELLDSIATGLSQEGQALLADPRQKLEKELSALAIARSLRTTIQRHKTYTLINFRY